MELQGMTVQINQFSIECVEVEKITEKGPLLEIKIS